MIGKFDNDDESSGGHMDFPYLMPMLDMVLILLFFFVIMSNSAQNVFDIKLPAPDNGYQKEFKPDLEDKKIKIFIKPDVFMIDNATYLNIDEFKAAIQTQINNVGGDKNKLNLTIASDKAVDVERFLKVMTFLKSSGLEKVDIIMSAN